MDSRLSRVQNFNEVDSSAHLYMSGFEPKSLLQSIEDSVFKVGHSPFPEVDLYFFDIDRVLKCFSTADNQLINSFGYYLMPSNTDLLILPD